MKFKLPFGLKSGELLHISEVEKGLACDCTCPSCEHPLVARKGEKTSHHFAHHKGKECEHGLETALHIAAKEILKKHKKIILPETFMEIQGENTENWKVSKEIQLNFDKVELETYQQGIVPDVLVYIQEKPFMIEITVTHKTSKEKIEKARKQGVSILEINLEHFERDFSIENLENEIIHKTSNKKWLLNIKAEKFKHVAYVASERKIFKNDKIPFCPKGLKQRIKRTDTVSNMSWMQWRDFNWDVDCSKCEFCLDIKHETVGAIYDKKGFPMSTEVETTVFCLGKNQIKNPNDLIKFVKENKQ